MNEELDEMFSSFFIAKERLMTPLKTVRKSVRMTERDYEFIESLPGTDFSDKLCYLISRMREQGKETSTDQIMARLNNIELLIQQRISSQSKEI